MEQKKILSKGGFPVVAGIVGGVAITIAVPWVILQFGSHLAGWVQGLVIVLALLIGGLTALVAAFFGTVMPNLGWTSDIAIAAINSEAAVEAIKARGHNSEADAEEPTDSDSPPPQ